MGIFDDPERIDYFSPFIIGHLFEIQMRSIEWPHAGVSVILFVLEMFDQRFLVRLIK